MKAEIIIPKSSMKLKECKVFDIACHIVDNRVDRSLPFMVVGRAGSYQGRVPIVYRDGSGSPADPEQTVEVIAHLDWS